MLLTFVSFSCKKEGFSNATIVKNCTGTYLQVLDKAYKVCNTKKAAAFTDQQKVLVNFNLIKECKNNDFSGPICAMAYPFEGIANIIHIKRL